MATGNVRVLNPNRQSARERKPVLYCVGVRLADVALGYQHKLCMVRCSTSIILIVLVPPSKVHFLQSLKSAEDFLLGIRVPAGEWRMEGYCAHGVGWHVHGE